MSFSASWSYPTSIRIGSGCIREVTNTCRSAGIRNPLIVTDHALATSSIFECTVELLQDAGLRFGLFSGVEPNPTEQNLAAGIEAFLGGTHDGVIAFGGGSSLDLGKLIALMSYQTISVWDLVDESDNWLRADADVVSPVIAVPTTAGTGSEVGRAAVLINSTIRSKRVIFHPKLLPTAVLADPDLTVSLPASITAGTGMDAFAHCLEAYCADYYHPMSQGIALEGMRLVKESLLDAYNDGENLDARCNMMSAAIMGAVAFQRGLGAIHALSHPIGAVHNTHHGTTNAVLIPPVLKFNRVAIESKIARAADYLQIVDGFNGFLSFVEETNSKLGIPRSLSELGVDNPDLDNLVDLALDDPSAAGNPVTMTRANTLELLRQSL